MRMCQQQPLNRPTVFFDMIREPVALCARIYEKAMFCLIINIKKKNLSRSYLQRLRIQSYEASCSLWEKQLQDVHAFFAARLYAIAAVFAGADGRFLR